jgi:hypothetical protein
MPRAADVSAPSFLLHQVFLFTRYGDIAVILRLKRGSSFYLSRLIIGDFPPLSKTSFILAAVSCISLHILEGLGPVYVERAPVGQEILHFYIKEVA